MAWTTPKTDWATGELVSADDLNAIGENLALLRNPPTALGTLPVRVETGSAVYIDVHSNFNLELTTTGGDVLAVFSGTVDHDSTRDARAQFAIEVDGVLQGDWSDEAINKVGTTFAFLVQNVSPGTHTFKLKWRAYNRDIQVGAQAQFWVREI